MATSLDANDEERAAYGARANARAQAVDGNSLILGGPGNDRLFGGDGDDRLFGRDGSDALYGGAGNDTLYGEDDNDSLYAGIGNDRSLGGGGNDRLFGGDGNDRLYGEAGSDTLYGEDGDDALYGGIGNDRLLGGDGNDRLLGGDGNDRVFGEDGDDTLYGEDGADALYGGIGNDRLLGGAGNDRLLGGDGNDRLAGDDGNDTLYGEDGEDALYGGIGSDRLLGGDGSDRLFGDAGNDQLTGDDGNDTLVGGLGNDTLLGGIGNDTAIVDVSTDGADTVDLGAGDDVVNVSGAAEVRLTFTSAEVGNGSALDGGVVANNQDGGLAVRAQAEDGSGNLTGPIGRYDDEGITFVAAAGTTFDVRDLVSGAQRGNQFNVVTLGTNGADVIAASVAGTSANYYINAGGGDDIVTGAEGNDFLVGGLGNDILIGGAGRDGILGGGGNDTINSIDSPANIFAGVIPPEADTVDAGDGDDEVTGGRLDTLNGGAGTDNLLLNFGFDGPNLNPAAVTLTLDNTGTGTANDGTSIAGFEFVALTLTNFADTVNTGNVRASLDGQDGADVLTTGSADDVVFGGGGDDIISTGGGNDTIGGGAGADTVDGGEGDDSYGIDLTTDGADNVDLGTGNDTVSFGGFGTGQYRVTFTSAEVGNGNTDDAGSMANQDGGLAVRIQREDGSDVPTGDIARFDDEGITFVAGTQGILFDVRDLVSGAARGDTFEGVVLGTSGVDSLSFFPPFRSNQNFYYNAGMGDDTVTAGTGADFLVGGGGSDTLLGGAGDDKYIGGGGNDTITDTDGGIDQIAAFNVTTDGADQVDLGAEQDVFNVTATAVTNVRLTFTSADVGNGAALDGNNAVNEDGGLAVRLQAETAGNPAGNITRVEDEGITFVGGAGVTFDVRDLPTGTQRGETFEVVVLGTGGDDTLTALQAARPYYINGGAGNDTITGGTANDFLVGGGGDDSLTGGTGVDTFLGGAGADTFTFATNDTGRQSMSTADTIQAFADEDTIVLEGNYTLAANPAAPGQGEYAITGSGGNFLLTYNNAGTLHDIIVMGADPTGDVNFAV